jgi:Ca2+-binding RTX toxin-like protein
MISVKGVRSDPANPANPDRHELKEEISAYRLPALVGLMLASLMLYLRSFLPVEAKTAGEQGPPQKPFADPDEKDGAAPIDVALATTDGDPMGDGMQGHHTPDIPTDSDAETGPTVLRSRVHGAPQDANVLRPNELTSISAVMQPANTNDPNMLRDSIQNFPPPHQGYVGSGAPGGGSGGSSGSGNGGGGPGSDSDDGDDVTPPVRNRAPRNSGPVYLADVASAATLAIAMSTLLSQSVDDDGNALTVRNLRATSGTVTQLPDGSWLFTPSLTNLGRVVFSFEVWDGLVAVPQQAYSMVTAGPIDTGGGDDTGSGGDDDDDVCEGPGGGVPGYNPVIGGIADDVLIGTDGNDLIEGKAGNDVAYGGLGDDWIYGGDGRDQLSGGAGDDRIYGDADEDVLYGEDGNDLLDGGAASDVLIAGAGDDALFGADGDDVLSGNDGADQMSGGAGTDEMLGDAGHDIMFGDAGTDLMLGGAGRDAMFGGADADAMHGGDDADVMAGGTGDDALSGDAGDDLVQGEAGCDTLAGGDGADALYGGEGHDVVSDGAGADIVYLAAGEDRLVVAIDISGDHFDGGEGTDTLDYSQATEDVAFDLVSAFVAVGDAASDRISGFESYVGGTGDDTFIACDTPAILTGGEGDDRFQFVVPQNQESTPNTMFQITDFDVGDRVSISRYDFFKDLAEEIESQMESYFSEDGNSGPGSNDAVIRFRHDRDAEDNENTWIEIDFDRDEAFETTITMQGHHLFVVVEHA